MTDGQQLFLILTLLYLSGCFFWIDRRTVLFSSGIGGGWKAFVASERWGNSTGSLCLLPPVLPFGSSIAATLLPISISPTHIAAFNSQRLSELGRTKQSARISPITPESSFKRRGTALFVDNERFCAFADVRVAHRVTMLLNRIKRLDECEMTKELDAFWSKRLDSSRVKARLSQCRADCAAINAVCTVGFLVFFAVLPPLACVIGVGLTVICGAATMLSIAFLIAALYVVSARRNYAVCTAGYWGDVIKMVLCPPTALRAGSLLELKICADMDIMALAEALPQTREKDGFLESLKKDLENPDFPEKLPEEIRETCLWQNRAILRCHA